MISFLARLALRSVFRRTPSAQTRRPAKGQALRFESLEDRTVPTFWNVGPSSYLSYMNNASVHTSDTIVFAPGTYPQQIVYQGSSGVTLEGETGAVIEPNSVTSPATPLTLNGVDIGSAAIDIYAKNVVVEGLTVNGADDLSLSAGIRVINGGSATIKDNTVENIYGPTGAAAGQDIGVQVGNSLVSGSAGGGTAIVEDNTIETYAGAGVLVDGSYSSVEVFDNTIMGQGSTNPVAQYGVQESNNAAARVQGNTIADNTVGTSAGVYFYNDGASSVAALNTITGNFDGILVAYCTGSWSNVQIVNNTVQGSTGYAGILVADSSNVEVVANNVSDNVGAENGIALNYDTAVIVGSNDVYGNGAPGSETDGIYDYVGKGDQIIANNSYSNSGNGINLQSSTGDNVFNNLTWSNTSNGVQDLYGTNDAIWLGDEVINAGNGIYLFDTTGDTIVGKFIDQNGQYGIYVLGSTNTFIAANLVTGNSSGSIYIDPTSSGTTLIANWTSTAPVKDGTSGANGFSSAFSNSMSAADSACSGLSW